MIINPCKPYLTASAPRLTHWEAESRLGLANVTLSEPSSGDDDDSDEWDYGDTDCGSDQEWEEQGTAKRRRVLPCQGLEGLDSEWQQQQQEQQQEHDGGSSGSSYGGASLQQQQQQQQLWGSGRSTRGIISRVISKRCGSS
jgi:hypothetical protein